MGKHTKLGIAELWLGRYTGTPTEVFSDYILLVNFIDYVKRFSQHFNAKIYGQDLPMQTCTHDNITIINFGMGNTNAATIMDLLIARKPKGVLFLGKCGGVKKSAKMGDFILPIGAIRASAPARADWLPIEVPALPSMAVQKYIANSLSKYNVPYRTGVVYSTARRVWEWDEDFKKYLLQTKAIAVDMEVATIFSIGFANSIPRGALLLISDEPMTLEGLKTEKTEAYVNAKSVDLHLELGIETLKHIDHGDLPLKHFLF